MSGEEFKEQPLLSPDERRNTRIQALRLTRPQTTPGTGAQKAGEPIVSATDITGEQAGLEIGDTGAVAQQDPGLPLRSTTLGTDAHLTEDDFFGEPTIDDNIVPFFPPDAPPLQSIGKQVDSAWAAQKGEEGNEADMPRNAYTPEQDQAILSNPRFARLAHIQDQFPLDGKAWEEEMRRLAANPDGQARAELARFLDLTASDSPRPNTPSSTERDTRTADQAADDDDVIRPYTEPPYPPIEWDTPAPHAVYSGTNPFSDDLPPLPPHQEPDLPPIPPYDRELPIRPAQTPTSTEFVDTADKEAAAREVVLKKRAQEAGPLANLARAEVIPTGEINENPFNLKIEGVTVASEEHQTRNEDASFIDTEKGIVFICDGMGGHAAGDVASATASSKLKEILLSYAPLHDEEHAKQVIAYAIQQAHEAVVTAGKEPGNKGLGTTAVVGCFIHLPDGKRRLVVGNVGDSRVYLLRDKKLSQLTLDDNRTNMVVSIKAGGDAKGEAAAQAMQAKLNNTEDPSTLTQEERDLFNQRNVITQSLGHSSATPKFSSVEVAVDDRFAFCSDGPSDNQTDRELEEKMNAHPNPLDAARIIIEDTQTRGKINPENIDASHPEGKPDHPRGKPDDYTFIVAEALAVPEKMRTPEEEVRDGINRTAEQLHTYLQYEPGRQQMEAQMNAAIGAIYAGSRVTELGTNTNTGPYMFARYVREGRMLDEEFNTFAGTPDQCVVSPEGQLDTKEVLRFLVLGSGIQRSLAEISTSSVTGVPEHFAGILTNFMRLENAHPVLHKFIARHKDEFTNFLQKYSQK